MTVTVVSCLYGEGYDRFVPAWLASVRALNRQPDEIIIGSDIDRRLDGVRFVSAPCSWRYPQAFHLQQAFEAASPGWVWHLDIDDVALPDALDGLEDVAADVWQMGYLRADGLRYTPPHLTAAEYLAQQGNPFVGTSAVRTEAFARCGGYPDIAFEDWGLWRSMARTGATFESSGRIHFRYAQGSYTRSSAELKAADRACHLQEMYGQEAR